MIHSNCRRAKTGMTAEALGVSVAPSFFHTCVSEGKVARPEEVQKFKVVVRLYSPMSLILCDHINIILCLEIAFWGAILRKIALLNRQSPKYK